MILVNYVFNTSYENPQLQTSLKEVIIVAGIHTEQTFKRRVRSQYLLFLLSQM